MKLLVVESPTKIPKLQSLLGDGWKVAASVGHIRDLPRRELGIDTDTLAMTYEFTPDVKVKDREFPGGEKRVQRIKALADRASMVYLAADPDREGEAIAWHLKETLGLDESEYQRITFDSITKEVIFKALEAPRKIDYNLVHAQEGRRALDRLVGYLVSPMLSNGLGMAMSAGRVQSPAVRIVVDRERQIANFKKTDHFGATLSFAGDSWRATWDTKPFVTDDNPYVLDKALAETAAGCRSLTVDSAESKPVKRAPPSAFSTSLLLQAASASLKIDPEKTAKLVGKLFEKGLVTYPRTDSVNLSDEAVKEVREQATANGWPVPEKPRKFKAKGDAQEAHEAIRPTHFEDRTAGDTDDEKALYELIWLRSVACQLDDAVFQSNKLVLSGDNDGQSFTFTAKSQVLKEPGWKVLTAKDAVSEDDDDEDEAGSVPLLAEGDAVEAESGKVIAKQTKPPSRYTQASLVAKLEAEGVGRPSTYPAIMQNILGKRYLVQEKRQLKPTKEGCELVDALVKAGFNFIELDFTKGLESQLDAIAEGQSSYDDVVRPAYDGLKADISAAQTGGSMAPRHPCPKCETGLRRIVRPDKAPFWACTNTECKTFMDDDDGKPVERLVADCPKCSNHTLRRLKRKKEKGYLWACTTDDCKTFMDDEDGKPVAPKVHTCPTCKKAPLQRYRKKDKETKKPLKTFGWFCTDENCPTWLDDRAGSPVIPKTAPCPECQRPMVRRKSDKGYWWGCTGYKEGCKVTMDDKGGKPVPRKAKA